MGFDTLPDVASKLLINPALPTAGSRVPRSQGCHATGQDSKVGSSIPRLSSNIAEF